VKRNTLIGLSATVVLGVGLGAGVMWLPSCSSNPSAPARTEDRGWTTVERRPDMSVQFPYNLGGRDSDGTSGVGGGQANAPARFESGYAGTPMVTDKQDLILLSKSAVGSRDVPAASVPALSDRARAGTPACSAPAAPPARDQTKVPLPRVQQSQAPGPRYAYCPVLPPPATRDEVWVIERRPVDPARRDDDDRPGTGALMCYRTSDPAVVPVPLDHTDVRARIDGPIASVVVTQQFKNPYSEKIEATYVFPLPDNAAVSDFIMTIGDRRIRGIVRDRAEAEQIYTDAKAQGYTASLLTQERPNIFTQKVANIEPGKGIDVSITYYNTLAFEGSASSAGAEGSAAGYQFVFPMVVGPRYNPAYSPNGVGAVGRGNSGASGQRVEVPYLRPGERSGHDISVAVEIDAGVKIEDIKCRSHAVEINRCDARHATVVLSQLDSIPNKDFVLSYRVVGEGIKTGILTHRADSGESYFTMMLVPPAQLAGLKRAPVEMVFVLDASGSMNGRPMEQAKAAAKRALMRLQPGDTFQVINFANTASQLGSYCLEATPGNVQQGIAYLDTLSGQGGTEMLNGLRACLDFPLDPSRPRYVCFLTDGFIGNEADILGELQQRLRTSRVFAFGIGSSVNRYLINHMARIGRGAAGFVTLADAPEAVMDEFFDAVSHPAMTDLQIDWGGAEVSGVYPSRLPDLFVGRPVFITGRLDGNWKGKVKISGRTPGGERESLTINPRSSGRDVAGPALAKVWARMKIADLSDRSTFSREMDFPAEIRRAALESGLMSQFTAMIAVDSAVRTAGSYGVSVPVPVAVPEGTRYETTVGESGGR